MRAFDYSGRTNLPLGPHAAADWKALFNGIFKCATSSQGYKQNMENRDLFLLFSFLYFLKRKRTLQLGGSPTVLLSKKESAFVLFLLKGVVNTDHPQTINVNKLSK